MKIASLERMRRLPLLQPLALRDFRLLWLGQSISLFGDQFYLVALYWLALQLSNSPSTLGKVLMIAGGSQALFQLIGGAVGDRFPPRALMLGSDLSRGLFTLVITATLLLSVTEVWHLYVLAALFGAVEAFFYPAYMAAIPMLLTDEQLAAGNALLRGTRNLMRVIGDPLAGIVISKVGLVAAFVIDTATFFFAAVMLWMMRLKGRQGEAAETEAGEAGEKNSLKGLFKSIGEGFKYAWHNKLVRSLLIFVAVIEFSFSGPATIGMPVMAKARFGDLGEIALGWMLGSLAAGMFIGMLFAGSVPIRKNRGRIIIAIVFMLGIGMTLLSFATNILWASLVLALMGFGGGLGNIIILSWLQSSAEPRVLGRVLSLMMFGISVLEPISFWIAGEIADRSLTWMFVGGGVIMLVTSLLSLASRAMRAAD